MSGTNPFRRKGLAEQSLSSTGPQGAFNNVFRVTPIDTGELGVQSQGAAWIKQRLVEALADITRHTTIEEDQDWEDCPNYFPTFC